MEMAVAMLLIVFIVGVLAFWPERWTHLINRVHKPRQQAGKSVPPR
jgi:hypothetical protein